MQPNDVIGLRITVNFQRPQGLPLVRLLIAVAFKHQATGLSFLGRLKPGIDLTTAKQEMGPLTAPPTRV